MDTFHLLAAPEELMGSLEPVADGAACYLLRVRANGGVFVRAISGLAHVTIVLEKGVSATVFLTLSGACALEAFVAEEATLEIICLESGMQPSSFIFKSRTEAGGSIYWHTVTLGHGVTQRLFSDLAGAGARSDIDCLFCVDDSDRQTLEVSNVFQASDGSGEIRMRGIAEGKGFASCRGKILIGDAGRGTDTYLTQDVLMLDATAKVDAIPELEIRTNDVKASHSATVSRVTAEDLFYFASRGLRESVARPMFIDGFAREALLGIPDPEVRDAVEAAVQARSAIVVRQ